MNGNYSLYKRDPDGTQGEMITDYTKLEIDLQWGKNSKIRIDGLCKTGESPVNVGDGIIIYRNGEYFIGGIMTQVETECQDPSSGVKRWKASGEDDSILFSYRQVLADPVDLTFNGDTYDRTEGYAYNRLIHYIYNNGYRGTTRERWYDADVTLPSERPVGNEGVNAYRSTSLSKVLETIGKADGLHPRIVRNPKTGAYSVTIPEPRDKTEDIIISPEFGNVTKWSRKDKAPSCNCVWAVSGDYSKGRLYVYAEDVLSIAEYGRIEAVVTKSDIKVWEDDGKEHDESEVHLTEEDVMTILEEQATNYIRDHGVKRTWSVTVAELRDLAFLDDWQVGDYVTCVIDGEKFETQITAALIVYEKGFETVTPTVGTLERGLFGELFDITDGLDDRITQKENE